MKVTITPSAARGIIEAPPSKSMAHRLLICAGLAEGISVITNVDLSGILRRPSPVCGPSARGSSMRRGV